MSFVQPVPTYIEFLETVLNIQDCLHSFQSETQLDIIRHIYPYTCQTVKVMATRPYYIRAISHH